MGDSDRQLSRPAEYEAVFCDQVCPAFLRRRTSPPVLRECRACRYADFQTQELDATGVGICYWPHFVGE